MKKILANDGMEEEGIKLLEKAGFIVVTEKVAQDELAEVINENDYMALTVRSATKVNKALIDECPTIRLIARGGVGMDNIDVEYAKSKNIQVVNTPAASSLSVAELVIGHIFSMARFLDMSNKNLPVTGQKDFAQLKKAYSKGIEVSGKTIGVIGFGRIGQSVGKLAVGLGMNVIAFDPYIPEVTLEIELPNIPKIKVPIKTLSLDEVLAKSDFITVHVPGGELITSEQIKKMKKGVMLVNASRGGVINEADLIEGLNSGHIAHAALDVFVGEPSPKQEILQHPKISLSPHIGGSTEEAQQRIGVELAEKIIHFLR
ncbi:MAG TPA: D-2-hydroxyacid dehydrogenase [Bacteroidia bacterium]|jgi:D-3-phosphoglycerate dehydrogenase|nr:D-2-hydroxyacid dehydrogenase [Bacteroidia bacterium]